MYEKYYKQYKDEIEQRTGTYSCYGRGFMIFYKDKECRETIVQFNLACVATRYSLNASFMEFQCKVISMMKDGMFFKTP